MPKRDLQATAEMHFQDPDSFVFKDGREFLKRKDWDARRFELLLRCGGRCEFYSPATGRCSRPVEEPHHRVKRSIAHDDRMSNLLGYCGFHHRAAHPEKQIQKLEKQVAL